MHTHTMQCHVCVGMLGMSFDVLMICQACIPTHIHMYMYIGSYHYNKSQCVYLSPNYNFHRTDADGGCTCKVTSCMAAYYSRNERPPPAQCSRRNKCAGLTGEILEKCLRKWGKCVKNAFKAQHGNVRMHAINLNEATHAS